MAGVLEAWVREAWGLEAWAPVGQERGLELEELPAAAPEPPVGVLPGPVVELLVEVLPVVELPVVELPVVVAEELLAEVAVVERLAAEPA